MKITITIEPDELEWLKDAKQEIDAAYAYEEEAGDFEDWEEIEDLRREVADTLFEKLTAAGAL